MNRRRRTHPALIIAIVAGVPLVVGLVACAGAVLYYHTQPSKPAAKTYTREEFRALVIGKTPDEVIAAVGRPDRTQEPGRPDSPIWYYNERTKDPVTGNVDPRVQVVFENGRVDRVNYH